jgi:hypothetical protein
VRTDDPSASEKSSICCRTVSVSAATVSNPCRSSVARTSSSFKTRLVPGRDTYSRRYATEAGLRTTAAEDRLDRRTPCRRAAPSPHRSPEAPRGARAAGHGRRARRCEEATRLFGSRGVGAGAGSSSASLAAASSRVRRALQVRQTDRRPSATRASCGKERSGPERRVGTTATRLRICGYLVPAADEV